MAKKTPPVEIPASMRPVVQAAAKNLLHHLLTVPAEVTLPVKQVERLTERIGE